MYNEDKEFETEMQLADEKAEQTQPGVTGTVCHGCLRLVVAGSGPDDACIPTLVVAIGRCQKAREREWEKEPGMRKRYDGTALSEQGARDLRRSR